MKKKKSKSRIVYRSDSLSHKIKSEVADMFHGFVDLIEWLPPKSKTSHSLWWQFRPKTSFISGKKSYGVISAIIIIILFVFSIVMGIFG